MASIFSVFKRGLEKSATRISRAISGVFTGIKAHGDASFEELEAMLASMDSLGFTLTTREEDEAKNNFDDED